MIPAQGRRLVFLVFLPALMGILLPAEESSSLREAASSLAEAASSQEKAGPPLGGLISSVSISGLERTKKPVAEKCLQKFIGTPAGRLNPNEVRAAVLDTGVLEPLSVTVTEENGGYTLAVAVREKWSVFPIPMVMVSSDGVKGGAFFADTNAFGLMDKLFAGGMYGSAEWMLGAGYMHSPLRENFPSWRTSVFFSRQERHDTDQEKEDLRFFDLDSLSVSGSLVFSLPEIGEFPSALSLDLSYGEKIVRDKEKESSFRAPGADVRILGVGAGVSLRRSSWDGYLLSEEGAFADYTWHVGIAGSPSFHSAKLRLLWEKSVIPGLRVTFRGGGVYVPDAPVLYESSPSAAQVNILPASFSAKNYAGISLGLEKYLFKTSFGTLSVLGSWQGVFSHGSVLGDQTDQGVAAALSLYMSRLAIPALSLGAAYNISARYFQSSFSMGMSF
jgi:hypothetical protein